MSFFESTPLAPDDPIMSLPSAFAREAHPRKVNLGVGIYKNSKGYSVLLNSVKKAEKWMSLLNQPKDYLPLDGESQFVALGLDLIFSKTGMENGVERIIGLQTLGGTGALSLAGFLLHQQGIHTIFVSQPTWPNHDNVFNRCGLKMEIYPYYDANIHAINFEAMCTAIKNMPAKSAILLQACCHNPTGFDLSQDQWRTLFKLVKERNILPLFDMAYHGFGGNLDEELFPIHHFLEEGLEFFVAYSFSKNFGLYGERVGLLAGVFKSPEVALRVRSQFKILIRSIYSNPPIHGAAIVTTILSNPKLQKLWMKELDAMCKRIQAMRAALAKGLIAGSKKIDFNFLTQQQGLFSFCGLTLEQAKLLRSQYGIYTPSNGRINIAGLNADNVDYVVESILAVMEPT